MNFTAEIPTVMSGEFSKGFVVQFFYKCYEIPQYTSHNIIGRGHFAKGTALIWKNTVISYLGIEVEIRE